MALTLTDSNISHFLRLPMLGQEKQLSSNYIIHSPLFIE